MNTIQPSVGHHLTDYQGCMTKINNASTSNSMDQKAHDVSSSSEQQSVEKFLEMLMYLGNRLNQMQEQVDLLIHSDMKENNLETLREQFKLLEGYVSKSLTQGCAAHGQACDSLNKADLYSLINRIAAHPGQDQTATETFSAFLSERVHHADQGSDDFFSRLVNIDQAIEMGEKNNQEEDDSTERFCTEPVR